MIDAICLMSGWEKSSSLLANTERSFWSRFFYSFLYTNDCQTFHRDLQFPEVQVLSFQPSGNTKAGKHFLLFSAFTAAAACWRSLKRGTLQCEVCKFGEAQNIRGVINRLWPMLEGDELYSSHYTRMQFNTLCRSLKLITFVVFLLLVSDCCK